MVDVGQFRSVKFIKMLVGSEQANQEYSELIK